MVEAVVKRYHIRVFKLTGLIVIINPHFKNFLLMKQKENIILVLIIQETGENPDRKNYR